MKNYSIFRGGGMAVLAALALVLFSCQQNADELTPELTPVDISEIYGYTFYGTITAQSGNTLTPSLILYNEERADWNMSVNGMNVNQFYYYAVKNSVNNYTLYWFGGADQGAAMTHDKSKAAMTVQLGINSLNEVVILLTGDGLTGLGKMQNTRVPMTKQTAIPRNTDAPAIAFDPSIQDVKIEIPGSASAADWDQATSYTGKFDYLVGPDGNMARGHGTSGKDSGGNEIIPQIGITPDAAGTHTAKVKTNRFAYTQMMTIEAFEVPNVKVFKDGAVYYLRSDAASVPAVKGDGSSITLNDVTVHGELKDGKLTLRVAFKPGLMPFPITEIFKSN